MFKALLVSTCYDLSDVKLAEALDSRSSFRRCSFSASEPTQERTAFVRFRKALVAERNLDKTMFEATTAQFKTRATRLRIGTLVDATIVASTKARRAEPDSGDAL